MKLKFIFSPFYWTVPSWKINRISRCFRWMLEPLHNATPRTWTSEILWPVELKCWATGNPGVFCVYFADVRWSHSWGFVLPVSQMCREVSIGGRICNRQGSHVVKADLTLFDISFTESLTSIYGFGRWYGLKGNIGYVFKILIYTWNIALIFTIWVEYHQWNGKRKQKKYIMTGSWRYK